MGKHCAYFSQSVNAPRSYLKVSGDGGWMRIRITSNFQVLIMRKQRFHQPNFDKTKGRERTTAPAEREL